MSGKFSKVFVHFGFYGVLTCLWTYAESPEISEVSRGEMSGVSEEFFGVSGFNYTTPIF
jgi:hypothetical protein